MPFILSRNRVIICLLLFLSLLPSAFNFSAGAQAIPSGPVLARAAMVAPPTETIAIVGHGFTPGGLVYIAVFNRWGADDVHQHVWAVATSATYGEHGSQDPARGYTPAGSLYEVIDLPPETVYGPNGSMDPAQGYDPAGDEAVYEPGAMYGPNGSQDPAQGYVPAGDQSQSGVACGRDLMIRAYDQQAATWSNLIDVVASC